LRESKVMEQKRWMKKIVAFGKVNSNAGKMESGQRPAATKKVGPGGAFGRTAGAPCATYREGAGVPRPSPGHALLNISQAVGFDRLVAKVQLARALRQTKTNPPRAASSPAARRLKSRRRLASAQPSGGSACRLLAPLRRQVRARGPEREVSHEGKRPRPRGQQRRARRFARCGNGRASSRPT
jgi:hypothetical protein